MAKYTVKIKDIAENYYAKNIKEVQEIDNIDDAISAKLSSMYEETVNEDTTVSV